MMTSAYAFIDECQERDASDPFGELLSATPGPMVRYSLGHDVEPYPWLEDDDELEERAQAIAEAAGIDFAVNRDACRSLVVEASYGGALCVLHRSDLGDLLPVLDGGRATFTDPFLVVYDGLNGSGSMEEVKGTVSIDRLSRESVRHDAGRYSWSDDIAGLVHSCAETRVSFSSELDTVRALAGAYGARRGEGSAALRYFARTGRIGRGLRAYLTDSRACLDAMPPGLRTVARYVASH
jgi:hypothetical protein